MMHRSFADRPRSPWRRMLGAAGLGLLAALTVPATTAAATGAGRLTPAAPDLASRAAAYVRARTESRTERGFTLGMHAAKAIPAFARKYNLPCSACHTAWPELNVFGQRFKDNGYQLGNDRDSPIWVNPAYIPLAFRTTPQWHMERTTHQMVDGPGGVNTVDKTITVSGFDISGADFLMMGTLYKDITFGFVPTVEDGEGVGIEAAFVRFDNLFKSSWANLKMGKFELDNMLSEKRGMTLSGEGGPYQTYHFVAPGDGTDFGMGDNQIGVEWQGHSANSYTRFTAAVLEGTDGVPGLPAGKNYDLYGNVSHAFDAGKLGVQRLGLYGYFGKRPTAWLQSGSADIPGTGSTYKSFSRIGAVGDFFFGNLEIIPLVQHAKDPVELAGGSRDAKWNSGLVELHYYVNPQLVFLHRSEIVRMSQQADPANAKSYGNVDAFTFGYRWYPIMISRAGLAVVGELSFTKTIGTPPLSGAGVGIGPADPTTAVRGTSLLLALDFDF